MHQRRFPRHVQSWYKRISRITYIFRAMTTTELSELDAPRYEDVSSCWICLEEGQNDSGQQLLRDCSCRGGSGFSHLSCLVEYAGYKYQQINDVSQFSNPWEVCPSCNQNYQNELAVNLATKFVDFVENTYADDLSRYLEALLFKLTTLHNNRREKTRGGYQATCQKHAIHYWTNENC